MSNGKVYKSNIYEFAKVLGIPANKNDKYVTIHQVEKFKKDNMIGLHDVNQCSDINACPS
jgi:hypothetical protein